MIFEKFGRFRGIFGQKCVSLRRNFEGNHYETNNNCNRTAIGCGGRRGCLRMVCTAYEARDERDALALHHGRQREQSGTAGCPRDRMGAEDDRVRQTPERGQTGGRLSPEGRNDCDAGGTQTGTASAGPRARDLQQCTPQGTGGGKDGANAACRLGCHPQCDARPCLPGRSEGRCRQRVGDLPARHLRGVLEHHPTGTDAAHAEGIPPLLERETSAAGEGTATESARSERIGQHRRGGDCQPTGTRHRGSPLLEPPAKRYAAPG